MGTLILLLTFIYICCFNHKAFEGQDLFLRVTFWVNYFLHCLLSYFTLEFYFRSYCHLLLSCLLLLIISELIDTDIFPREWLKIVCGLYINWTHGFDSPTVLRKIVSRVMVVCNFLLMSINCFSWYKNPSKLITQCFHCWLLTFVFFVYWIRMYWSWNLSVGVNVNIMWAV